MKKKVLHVINSLKRGGAETLLVNSLSEGGLQEHTDNYVAYFQATSSLENNIDSKVKVYNLKYKGLSNIIPTLLRLRKIIRENNIDIVHSHLNPAGFYTHLICNVPQIHTMHTTYSTDIETPANKLFLEKHLFLKNRDCNLIFLSEFIKTDFFKKVSFQGRSFILNNFVSNNFFNEHLNYYKKNTDSLKVIAVGRLSPGKNYEYLIDVFQHLKDKNIFLDIYGGGDKSFFEKEIKNHKLNIRMMGSHADIANILPNYNLFIMPSKNEGFPLSVFEAMASGVPLLLSNIPPVKSIVNQHAIYFELNNPESVAQQLITIQKGEIDINTMAAEAKVFAEQTARRETYIDNLLKIYSEVLKKGINKPK